VSGEVLRLSPRGADWRMDVIDLVDEHRMRRKKQPQGGAEKKRTKNIHYTRAGTTRPYFTEFPVHDRIGVAYSFSGGRRCNALCTSGFDG